VDINEPLVAGLEGLTLLSIKVCHWTQYSASSIS